MHLISLLFQWTNASRDTQKKLGTRTVQNVARSVLFSCTQNFMSQSRALDEKQQGVDIGNEGLAYAKASQKF